MGMKTIADIYEKLKVDDIVLTKEFPMDGTLDDMIKFLKKQDFIDISNESYHLISEIFNKKRKKCIIKFGNNLSFADTSKGENSKDDPIFYICFIKPRIYSVYYSVNNNVVDIVENDKKKFLEELNKRFGWE